MLTKKILLIDVETANDLDDPLVYDLGLLVVGEKLEVIESYSLVISDIFNNSVLMDSAYYADKMPMYLEDLAAKVSYKVNFWTARKLVTRLMREYGITEVYAYNCNFDRNALTKTFRYLTKSKFRWFFPFGTEFKCIWHIACQTLGKSMDYYDYCIKNGFFSPAGNVQTSAEVMYRYMTNDSTFKEEHTGLADCLIELEILEESLKVADKENLVVDMGINRLCWRIPQKPKPKTKKRRAERQKGRE